MHFMYQHALFGTYINAVILLFLQRVLLLVASDVDALCACKILQVSLGSLSLQADSMRKYVCPGMLYMGVSWGEEEALICFCSLCFHQLGH